MTHKQKIHFKALQESALKTTQTRAIKELAMSLCQRNQGAQRPEMIAVMGRLNPIKDVTRTVKERHWRILNAIILKASSGRLAGSISSWMETIKVRSRGFRSKARSANAIYFHFSDLTIYQEDVAR